MEYETVIGLEVHLQLKTNTKVFCNCSTEFGKSPNTQTCPVCLGFPGALPVLNESALLSAIKVGLALNCKIQEFTKFDRKHYYYPDLPKNYQISQYDLPIAKEGYLDIFADNQPKRINICRVHLEEDAGKLIHQEEVSFVDYNRTGLPLLEIVTEPEINSPQEAYAYLTHLKSLIEYLDVSDCDMEKGSLRCDANISLRPVGAKTLGVKAELKNMNSFRALRDALSFEVVRQTKLLKEAQAVIQETRLWDVKEEKTFPMRTKEEAKDYRYFPEPDLPPFIIAEEKIAEIKRSIPELPREKMLRFIKDYPGVSEYYANILVASKKDADFAEECMKVYPKKDKKIIADWLVGPVAALTGPASGFADLKIPGAIPELIKLISLVEDRKISYLVAKTVFSESATTGKLASAIIEEKNLYQVSDTDALESIAVEVIKENPKSVQDYKSGKTNAIMFLVGQVMKKSKGKANPKVVQEILKSTLDKL
jgi:aspartyl-tRNA(Asn)/glutamyl-tRNA(Gln) amidotransferase subunit B